MSPPSQLRLAIHGPTAAAHELHTGESGSFEAVMRALGEGRAHGRPTLVASFLTRSSCRSLVALGERLGAHAVAGWAIVWPTVHEAMEPAAARVVPRLGIAVPHALRAVVRAAARGIAVVLVDVPLCVLGPHAARRLPPGTAGAGVGTYPAPCRACPARSQCPGLDPWYLRRFGAEELHPVPRVPPAPLAPALAEGLARTVREMDGIAP